MMFVPKNLQIHMIGIGGSGMSGIAELLLNLGYTVSGSDLQETHVTRRLQNLGATICIGHRPENIHGAGVVVASSAIRPNNPEIVEAEKRGIPVIPRVEMLTEIMRLRQGIAIAGAHGKTTTTSMIGTVLAKGSLDPTLVVGGRLRSLGTNAVLGQGQWVVVESDESDGSFLKLAPTISVITNIDREHMERYGHLDALVDAFIQFGNSVPFYGATTVCMEDRYLQNNLYRLKRRVITYGLHPQSHYWASDIAPSGWSTVFTLHGEDQVRSFKLNIPGAHNVLNALASIAVGRFLGLDWDIVQQALEEFQGVDRRFQLKGRPQDIWIVDDYAHHPTEIKRTLETALALSRERIIVVFQPHRYSRVSFLWEDFRRSFYAAHKLIVLPIYPAGEDPIPGVEASRLAEDIRQSGHRDVVFMESLDEAVQHLVQQCKPGDLVLTLGAGNVYQVGEAMLQKIDESDKSGGMV